MNRNFGIFWVGVLAAVILAGSCQGQAAPQVSKCVQGQGYKTVLAYSSVSDYTDGIYSFAAFPLEQQYNVHRIGPGDRLESRLYLRAYKFVSNENTGKFEFTRLDRGELSVECAWGVGGWRFFAECTVPSYADSSEGKYSGPATINVQFDVVGNKVGSASSAYTNRYTILSTTHPYTSSDTYKFAYDQYQSTNPVTVTAKSIGANPDEVVFLETFTDVILEAGILPRSRSASSDPYGCY